MPINWIYEKRSTEVAAIVAHSFLSVIVIVIVLISCIRRTKLPCVFLRFYGHTATFILAFVTVMVQMFEVLEGILIDVKTSSFRPFLHASNVLGVIAVCLLLVLYYFAETRCCGAYLLLILAYWSATAAINFADVAILNSDNVGLAKDSAKLLIVGLMSGLCFLQAVLSIVVIFKQGIRRKAILASSQSKKDGEDLDLAAIEYLHRYVSFPSKVLLHWFNKVLVTGFKKCLTLEDLGQAPRMESSEFNFRKLKAFLEEEKKLSFERNKPVSLSRCFWKLTKPMMLLGGTFKIVSDMLLYTPILCLDAIISFLVRWESQNSTEMIKSEWIGNESYSVHSRMGIEEFFTNGYVLILVCFFIQIFQMTLFQQHLFLAVREGIRCKCALQALVFDKSLRLSVSDINEGKLMNHMTVDPLHIVMIFMFFHSIWTMPFQVLVGLVLLYLQLGTSALISGLLILTMVFVQYMVGKRLGITQEKIMKQADERLKKSNEMLQSIKLLKLYAWERIFYQSVISTRTRELRLMLTAAILRVFSIAVTDGIPYFACLLTFTLYHYMESQPLNPGKVFSGLALFSIFGGQLFLIILMIYVASQAMASVNRLRNFLLLPEIPTLQLPSYQIKNSSPTSLDESHNDKVVNGSYSLAFRTSSEPSHSLDGLDIDFSSVPSSAIVLSDFAIEISNGNFSYSGRQLLHDITVKIPAGRLTMVIGPVGCGKSSLLLAMLGEMNTNSGKIIIRGRSIAFVAQKSWIVNSTVLGNILFGLPFDPVKYHNVVEASGLGPDLQMFPAGDQTEIGEKGANLSGGQRQRVSIARALYADSDIYFMDDPLSALDAQVGLHIFEEVIMRSLISRGKTVVLVTHHVQYLPRAHHLLVMQNGRIFYEGASGDFISRPGLLSPGRSHKLLSGSRTSLEPERESFHHISHRAAVSAGIKAAISFSTLSILSEENDYSEANQKTSSPGKELAPEISEAGRLIEEEEVSTGAVSYRFFVAYFRAATFLLSGLTLAFYTTRLSVRLYADYWLTDMVDASVKSKSVKTNVTSYQSDIGGIDHQPERSVEYYLTIYSVLSVVAIVFVPLGSICLELTVLTASRNLHQQMLQRIVSAPLRFFDTTPIGRIVNRLAADMNVIDEKLSIVFDSFLFCVLAVFGGIVINCVFVPYFLVPVAPILVLFVFIQRFCIASCRELQRIDCSTKSPILAHFSQMLAGISTIRAYKCEERFQRENFEKVDSNNVAFLFFHTCHLWLGLRLDYLASFLVLFAGLSAVTTCQLGAINSSTVGFVVSYALMICALMNWTMRNLSEMEVYFGSVERIIQYSVIESEPYEESRGELPPKEWPSAGEITFESVSLKYGPELDPVVHEFSLHIEPGSKVGICGRTGSGKSSMTLSLFRMVYISHGRILLDGFDISDIPLELLRSKISIIPQEPVLFSGTVRFNLDPLKTKTDEEIWKALEIAQLSDLVLKLPQQLDMHVTEGGDNFSIGQRQMFCLARALLRDSKLLIMDEATASIDSETDLQIQKIVKTAFAHCTVITIAHRLSTILNYDLIVVLRDGRKIEEGKPKDLIRANGVFAEMLLENKM